MNEKINKLDPEYGDLRQSLLNSGTKFIEVEYSGGSDEGWTDESSNVSQNILDMHNVSLSKFELDIVFSCIGAWGAGDGTSYGGTVILNVETGEVAEKEEWWQIVETDSETKNLPEHWDFND